MPRVFAAERDAGLTDLLSKSTATLTAPLRLKDAKSVKDWGDCWKRICTRFQEDLKGLGKAGLQSAIELAEQLNQPDLAYLDSILVSTGWNLNDDVFLPAETWAARNSPVHKPINVEHEETQIIGHMIQSLAVDKQGNAIEVAEGNEPPAEFDVEVAGVLYRWIPALADKVAEIVKAAEKGELFVSMEAWFDEFSYALMDKRTGATRIVARDEQTAFLTKHLRCYGGTGEFDQYRLGRVLRNIIFAGKGIVARPANPESIIKDVAKIAASLTDTNNEGGATNMPNEIEALQAKVDQTTKALEAKTAEHQAVVAELEAIKARKLDEQVQTLTAKIAEQTSAIAQVAEAKTQMEKQVAEVTERATKAEAELAGIRKLEKARERLTKLSKVKKIEDTEASLKELAEMSDETFAVVLKYAGEKAPATTATEQSKTQETTTTEQPKTEDVATAALETVQPVEEPNLQGGQEDEAKSLIAVAKATASCLFNRNTEGSK